VTDGSGGCGVCDDGNPCTDDACANDGCHYDPLPNGFDCGSDLQCADGACVCPFGADYRSSFQFADPDDGNIDAVVLTDVDGDGDRDFVAHSDADDSDLAWVCYSNDGTGRFSAEAEWRIVSSGNANLFQLREINLNGDAFPDLVALYDGPSADDGIIFYVNDYRGIAGIDIYDSFLLSEPIGAYAYCVGDVDGNGKEDVAYSTDADTLGLLEVDAALGSIVERADLALFGMAAPLLDFCSIADLDGDGRADLVLGQQMTAHFFRQGADGSFAQVSAASYEKTTTYQWPDRPTMLDFTGDGLHDLFSDGGVRVAISAFDLSGGSMRSREPEGAVYLTHTCTGLPALATWQASQSEFGQLLQSNGERFRQSDLDGGVDVGPASQMFHGDLDGDGLEDVLGFDREANVRYTLEAFVSRGRM